MNHNPSLQQLEQIMQEKTIEQRLQALVDTFSGQKIVFSTSLGAEDQVITQAIAQMDLPIDVFTLETGRLFKETLTLLDRTETSYGLDIVRYYPDLDAVSDYIEKYGLNGFYEGIEQRKKCCFIRKVEPLNRALKGADVWITGLRQQQSAFRQALPFFEQDDERGLVKFNPLLDWTSERLWQEIDDRGTLVNPLHAKGFVSIGCEPCTRAIKPGEDERAGRWWWENPDQSQQECGLHVAEKTTCDSPQKNEE